MRGFSSKWFGFLSTSAALFISIPAQAADDHKTLTLDSRTLQSMRIDAGSGSLHIQGVEGVEQIEVVAKIVSDRGGYRLTLEKEGDTAVLVSEIKEWHFFMFGAWPRIDLTVKLPSRLLLDIKDGAGNIELSAMKAAAKIVDSSGSMSIHSHRGNVELSDGSGDIDIQKVAGNIRIEDGSGSMTAEDIVGDLDVRDGSGSITITNVDGHVTIHDGSGGIVVADIKQGLTISDAGSGGLSMARVEKGIDIDD